MTAAAAAIVLAGGRGTRLGGARKADLEVNGRRLLDLVLEAVDSCDPVIVVGEDDLVVPDDVVLTREEPPFAGPAAALGAGLDVLRRSDTSANWVLCLGCDQPGVIDAVPRLTEAATGADAEVDAISASGADAERIEWVCSILRRASLEKAVATWGPVGLVNRSMRSLLGDLHWDRVRVPDHATDDIDTWEDHQRWQHTPRPI